MSSTAFYWDERCFWHGGGNYVLTVPVGGLVQPLPGGGLPEGPEGKRRVKNLMDVTGLSAELECRSAPAATRADLARVHPDSYLDQFKALSDEGGGELGLRTPFGPGAFEIASLSAGLVTAAVRGVLAGDHPNAYALARPPGHHCLPDWPNGFCLLNNIAIAIEAARAAGLARRFAVLDWDVHHGNGTEAIYWEDGDVLTVSLHQDRNYPNDTGQIEARGAGAGLGANMNIPLPPGAGHDAYLYAMERLALPAIRDFAPEIIVVASGFDASGVDPLSRMLAGSDTFREMARATRALADEVCSGRLVLAHEGGYSDLHVPFCAHAVLEELSGSEIGAPDPLAARINAHQPDARMQAVFRDRINEMVEFFAKLPES